MTQDRKTKITLALATVLFLAMAVRFAGVPAVPPLTPRQPLVPAAALAIVPGTVRISAAQLIKSGGDASGLSCYACHHKDSPPVIKYDDEHRIVLPKEHSDLIFSMRNCAECHPPNDPVKLDYADDGSVILPEAHKNLINMAHGRNARNDYCFNCHDPNELDQLHTAEGAKLRFDQATLLCAGCHGPTYRDWEVGVHGRTGGFWDRTAGPINRQECASCHDPHAPAFTPHMIIPMPGPHLLHPKPGSTPPTAENHAP